MTNRPLETKRASMLPEAAHEVRALLCLVSNGKSFSFGTLDYNVDKPLGSQPPVIVYLGTRVTDSVPSCIGFRILLRVEGLDGAENRSLEDQHHLVSCKFALQEPRNQVICSSVTDEDLAALGHAVADPTVGIVAQDQSSDRILCKIDFYGLSKGFTISHHGPEVSTQSGDIGMFQRILPVLASPGRVSIYVEADSLLISHLERTIQRAGVGLTAPSWKESLPENAVPSWPSHNQTQMVEGSVDVVNVLNKTFHDPIWDDAPVTQLNKRPKARQFKAFVHKTYVEHISHEPAHKLFPIFLNVSSGICLELPFGASMLNRQNTYAGVNALHRMLDAGLSAVDIGIIVFYPAQAEAYKEALAQCHAKNPSRAYDQIKVGPIEQWVGKTVDFSVVDLSRTLNFTGNLGLLSQARRIKVALTLHRNGLVVIGDRQCTATSNGTITSTKLEKVLQWFEDKGRVVQVSDEGLPITSGRPSLPVLASHTAAGPSPATGVESQPNGRADSQAGDAQREKALKPDIEYVDSKKSNNHKSSDSLMFIRAPDVAKYSAAESFLRQGLPGKGITTRYSRNPLLETAITNQFDGSDWEATTQANLARNGHAHHYVPPHMRTAIEEATPAKTPLWSDSQQQDPRVTAWKTDFHTGAEKLAIQTGTSINTQDMKDPLLKSIVSIEPIKPNASPKKVNPITKDHAYDDRSTHVLASGDVEINLPCPSPIPLAEINQDQFQAYLNKSPWKVKNHTPEAKLTSRFPPGSLKVKLPPSIPLPVPSNNERLRTATQPATQTLSTLLATIPASTDQKLENPSLKPSQAKLDSNFAALHKPKHEAMCSLFDSMGARGDPSPAEDRAFRRLGQAFVREDRKAFDAAYVELLGMVQAMHL